METIKRNKTLFIILLVVIIIPAIIGICFVCAIFGLAALGVNTAQDTAMDTARRNDLYDLQLLIINEMTIDSDFDILRDIPECSENVATIGTNDYDLASVVNLNNDLPQDPEYGTQADTGYTICKNGESITLTAPYAVDPPVSVAFQSFN